MKCLRSILSLICASLFWAGFAHAQIVDNVVQVSFRSGWTQSDGTHIAGMQIDLAPGWKTYWRQPGDVGIPPQFDWTGSENLENLSVLWPRPKVTWDFGARSIGYDTRVILPLVIHPKHDGPITLRGRLSIGVCEDVCIPVDMNLKVSLKRTGATDAALSAAIKAQPDVKRTKVVCSFQPFDGGVYARLSIKTPKLGADEHMAVEMDDRDLWIGTPKLSRNGRDLRAEVKILSNSGKTPAIQRAGLRTTLISGNRAVEFHGCQAR